MKRLLLFFAVILSACLTASAYDFKVNGIAYNKNSDGNSVTVTYTVYYNPSNYNGGSGSLVIPEKVTYSGKTYTVTAIGDYAFTMCNGFTGSLNIPNSVTSIGDCAFSWCSGFTGSLNIPNSVTSIGNSAFVSCSGLTSIKVDAGNAYYDSRNNCNAIIETKSNSLITGCMNTIIPNSVSSIGNYAFFGCYALTSINIPNSVSSIGYEAFYRCSALTSINIPNSVSSIGNYAFDSCSGLTSVTIGNSVSSIGNRAFAACSALTSIKVDADNAYYDSRNNCNAIIETKSNSLITGCMNTIIPNSVSSIEDGAFFGCYALTSINIPNSVSSIGDEAFRDCYGLTSVTIGNSVTSIGYYVFYGCSGLTEIHSLNPQPPALGSDVFYNVSKSIPLYVPSQSISKYKAATGWKYFTNVKNEPVPATSITLNKTEVSLASGATTTLTATILPDNATNKTVTWKSSNNAIATVDSNGKVTGIAPGTATITATTTDGTNLSASCMVTVLAVKAQSISLNHTTLTLNDGQTETLVATVTPSNTTNKNVTWKSGNTTIASVDENGKVTGIAPGTATITATTTDGTNLSASCQVTVRMTAKSILINKTTLTLNDGQTETLVANVTPSNTTNKTVTWKSSNTAIATVDSNGKVTGVGPGTATITATTADGTNLSAQCKVTVIMMAKAISLNHTTLTLNDGQTETLVATVAPDNTTNKNVTWKSGNTAIASVDENGKVTGIAPGTATITATTTDGTNLSASCQITVRMTAKSISLNKTTLTLNDGQTETLVANVTPSNTTNKNVTWKSSNNAIASVDENGKVTGIAPGTATITATTTDCTNLSASCQVTVNMTAKSVSLNKTTLTLNDGQTETLVATVAPDNTTNKGVTWESSDTTITRVDAQGKVTAICPGTVDITATTVDGTNLSATCKVTVLMKAKDISLNKTTLSIDKGQSETLVATVLPDNTTNKNVTWKSSNTSVATVDSNGKVTGVGNGTVTITATTTDGTNLSASCLVTVIVKATGIALSSNHITIDEEKSTTLSATINPYNTTNKEVAWKSANPDIATVDSYGRVTGVTFGETTITAMTTDGTNLSASCRVTVTVKKLYSDKVNFFGGEEIDIAVKMRNSMEVTGFQTDIRIPKGYSFVVDEDGYAEVTLSDRATRGHSISATMVNSSTIRVLSYSSTSKIYSGNDGPLFNVKIISDWNAPIGNSVIELINTELAEPDGSKRKIDNTNFQLGCYYVPGDANHDKKVSVSDIVAEARYILLQNPVPFHYKSANLNEDYEISVSDIVLTANVILGRYHVDDKRFSVQRIKGGDALCAYVVESRRNGSRTIAIALDNSNNFTAFQADLCLPEGMEVTGARLSDRAGRSHTVAMNQIGGNTVRVLSYASDNAVFTGNSGDLLLIDVKGRGEIEMKNALFAEPNGCEHELDEITFSTELSGINDITVGNAPVNVYNTAGQLIRTNVNPETATQGLPAGFYLVGNKKVVVK